MSSYRRISQLAILVLSSAILPRAMAQDLPPNSSDEYEFTRYAKVRLTTDVAKLTEEQKKILPLLIEAVKPMDDVFWKQAFPADKDAFRKSLPKKLRDYATINYGPWDRLQNNQPFTKGFSSKPAGANFYPSDITKEAFEKHLQENPSDAEAFKSLYTLIRRNEDGKLIAVPYNEVYRSSFQKSADALRKAAALASDKGFKAYLLARADALLSNEYRESDMLWMDMKTNDLDIVIGPIENYEDQLFGYKAATEGYVLVKDMSWSERLSKYAKMLPKLQKSLPVDDKYKQESPGTNSDLNAYDVVYYAGDCNAGSKTHCHQLAQRRGSPVEKGIAAAAAQKHHAGQVRQNPRPHRRSADRSRTAKAHHI